jgi:hypothetical protein
MKKELLIFILITSVVFAAPPVGTPAHPTLYADNIEQYSVSPISIKTDISVDKIYDNPPGLYFLDPAGFSNVDSLSAASLSAASLSAANLVITAYGVNALQVLEGGAPSLGFRDTESGHDNFHMLADADKFHFSTTPQADFSSRTNLITIQQNGNVGIGTISPARKLHVSGGAGNTEILLTNTGTGETAGDGFMIQSGVTGHASIWNFENSYIEIGTNNVERMRVGADGNVGIGTNNPAAKLQVAGQIYSSTGGFKLPDGTIIDDASDLGPSIFDSTDDSWIGTGNIYTTSGNVGIGTTSPTHKLDITDDTVSRMKLKGPETGIMFNSAAENANWMIGRNTNNLGDAFYFYPNVGNPVMVLEQGGNIGIGTTSPAAKLQIINTNQDATGNTLILGPTTQSNLRLGYHADYSWIQSHQGKPLVINPISNLVAI